MNDARISHVQIKTPSIMLVRIDPGHEPHDLRLDEMPYKVLRVRHPLPACTRVEVMRPAVVLVGRSVQPRDFVLLIAASDAVGAAVMLVGALTSPGGLHEWVTQTVCAIQARRDEIAQQRRRSSGPQQHLARVG